MNVRLYVLPSSHPCTAVEAGFKIKGVAYKRIELLPLVAPVVGRIAYGGSTVPGARIDGERVVGSRAILKRLDALVPDPPLIPIEPIQRARVLAAERWGDETLQAIPRRIIDAIFVRQPQSMLSYAPDAKLPLPLPIQRRMTPAIARLMALKNKASDASVQADIEALPGHLDQIDAWLADGLLGGAGTPNVADLQIGASIQLLATLGDIAPLLSGRPCAALARPFPPLPGAVPPGVLPESWFAPRS